MIRDLGSDYRKSPKGVYIACGCSCCCCLHSVVAAGAAVYGIKKGFGALDGSAEIRWILWSLGVVGVAVAGFMTIGGGGPLLAVALLLPIILFVGSLTAWLLAEVGISIQEIAGYGNHDAQRAVSRSFFKELVPTTFIGMLVSPLGLLPLLLLK